MKLRTEIEKQKTDIEINHRTKILMLGSCFTNNMGQKLEDNKFNVNINPTGTLYNPMSILSAMPYIAGGNKFEKNDLFLHNGLYHSFFHHSDFSAADKDKALSKMNERLAEAQTFYADADILFITFGTAYVFEHIETQLVVSNCHKLPANSFNRYRLSADKIVAEWKSWLKKLEETKPNLQIIFTVSPIRHLKDGLHDNQVSKATLICAVNTLVENSKNAHYFPAYEIVLDDLRDYRFYERDMCHPSGLAIDYIWTVFKETYLTPESETIIEEWAKIKLAIEHRPFNEDTEGYIQFLNQTLLKLNKLGAKYPYICLNCERDTIERKINRI